MKKLIAMLLVGGALAVTTVGCGPAATSEPPTIKPAGSSTVKDSTSVKDNATVKDKADIKDKADVKDTVAPKDKSDK